MAKELAGELRPLIPEGEVLVDVEKYDLVFDRD